MDRWNEPFDANAVRGFLAYMREGATLELFRTRRGPGIEDADLVGWFQREPTGRFVGLTAAGNVLSGGGLRLGDAVVAFRELEPEWTLHNVAYKPRSAIGAVTDVSPVEQCATLPPGARCLHG